ncbi:sensor histidine kinase [Jannaschia aquimarina]|uniref:histidine kinase n=1 Tax=Jannaschia aquimarina TaxID=935700 RepID=A0A0D1EG81_9RHOB|nr:HWE histidine kinase domain-containing protein [Jannaschia aquimarina]KIT15921.1 Blue-light-activated histidine kinase 1 [Jannaschia aquimarina]SNS97853.1 PAS domain S-box-containing protein [Jannaschia aquimarina]
MRDQTGTSGRASALAALVDETDWQDIAAGFGGIGRFVLDLESSDCEIDETLRRLTGLEELVGRVPADRFIERIHPDDRANVVAEIRRAGEENGAYDVDFRFERPDGRMIWLTGQGRVRSHSDGSRLLIGVNYDITDLRQAQERSDLLAREMAHRMKNVFALVQGMFNMAARSAQTREALAEGFSGRLQALAAVNSLTFTGEDRAVAADALVDAILGPLIAGGRITAKLDPFAFNGTSAQTMVLALNELMTNAVKYGALANDDGHVDLSIEVEGDEFRFGWSERGVAEPVVEPEGKGGFGMQVLKTMTRATYSGSPVLDWRPEGLAFSCTWPAGQFGSGNQEASGG